MSFSEKYGYEPIRNEQQIYSFDKDTNIELWNIIYPFFHSVCAKRFSEVTYTERKLDNLFKKIVTDIARQPIDMFLPLYAYNKDLGGYFYFNKSTFSSLRGWWFGGFVFPQQMNMLELLCGCDEKFAEKVNAIFRKELVGYRVNDKNEIKRANSDEEAESVERAGKETSHIDKAGMQLKNGDYQNSIKESILAVEEVYKKSLGNNTKNTLAKNLKIIAKRFHFHPAFEGALDKLYGYASDVARHASDKNVEQEEALFILVTCSAFINFLKEKERNQPNE